jgi:4-carboxymuconolactone decarboxylase
MTDRSTTGRTIMTEVLGEEYVRRRDSRDNAFNAPVRAISQDTCYGEVWSRPGLDRETRSLLCLAMLTALNRSEELRMHLVGAVNNGCTATQIQEALLMTSQYCGLPAALTSFRIAEEVLSERGLI